MSDSRGGLEKVLSEVNSDLLIAEESGLLEANKGNQLLVLPAELSEPFGFLTRAKITLLMDIQMGMVYDCLDETAQN